MCFWETQITWKCGNTWSEWKQIKLMNIKIIFLTKITLAFLLKYENQAMAFFEMTSLWPNIKRNNSIFLLLLRDWPFSFQSGSQAPGLVEVNAICRCQYEIYRLHPIKWLCAQRPAVPGYTANWFSEKECCLYLT